MANKPSDADMAFVLSMLYHLEDGRVDWAAVGSEFNIGYARNAVAKFNAIAKAYEYKWERGKLVKIDGTVGEGEMVPKTPTRKRTKANNVNTYANEDSNDLPASSKKQKVKYGTFDNVEKAQDELDDSDQA